MASNGRYKKFIPQRFQTDDFEDTRTATITLSMLFSDAWQRLTPKQKELYIAMTSVLFNLTRSEREQVRRDYPGADDVFMFPKSRWFTPSAKPTDRKYYNYRLYSNERSFYRDLNALMQNGFIELAESNRHRHKKNVYRMSARWKDVIEEQ